MSRSPTTLVKTLWPIQLRLALVMIDLLLAGATSCVQRGQAAPMPSPIPSLTQPQATLPAVLPTVTSEAIVPAG